MLFLSEKFVDSETAKIAVRASITGHLVLSTIHTNNSLSTIERLLDMMLKDICYLVLYQVLFLKTCENGMSSLQNKRANYSLPKEGI